MSEHTAEFALVPDIIQRLQSAFPRTVPFYYWASREGTPTVRGSDSSYVRLVAAYPRRPKVEMWGQTRIVMKVNRQLFDHASILRGVGVPVFAGVPCVSRLTDHALGAACAWFFLNPCGLEYEDAFVELDIEEPARVFSGYPNPLLRGPLSTDGLLEIVLEHSTLMAWPEALDRIRSASRTLAHETSRQRYPWFGWPATYKPFYLALLKLV